MSTRCPKCGIRRARLCSDPECHYRISDPTSGAGEQIGTDGRVRGIYGEGTTARKFDTHPITGEEAARLSSIANGLRILHVNGCIHDACPECDYIAELHTILFERHGRSYV